MHGKKRLIVLANHRKARFVVAKGIKVDETVLCLSNRDESHSEPLSQPRVGHDKGNDSQYFPPHTDFKEIEKEHFAHLIMKELLKYCSTCEEVILACEPKMLGLLKKELSHHKTVKIYKALPLDHVDIDPSELEEKILEAATKEWPQK